MQDGAVYHSLLSQPDVFTYNLVVDSAEVIRLDQPNIEIEICDNKSRLSAAPSLAGSTPGAILFGWIG